MPEWMLIMMVVAVGLFIRRRRHQRRMYWMRRRMLDQGMEPMPPMSPRALRRMERYGPFGPMGPFGRGRRDDFGLGEPLTEPVAVSAPKPVARTETPMETLQRRYVEGALTVEEYESELDKLLRSK